MANNTLSHPTGHFEQLLESLGAPNRILVRHLLKDYKLMKKFLHGGFEPSRVKKDVKRAKVDYPDRDKPYKDVDQVLIIFGAQTMWESKRQ